MRANSSLAVVIRMRSHFNTMFFFNACLNILLSLVSECDDFEDCDSQIWRHRYFSIGSVVDTNRDTLNRLIFEIFRTNVADKQTCTRRLTIRVA